MLQLEIKLLSILCNLAFGCISCIKIELHLLSIFALFYEKSLTGSYNINLVGTVCMLIHWHTSFLNMAY